MIINNLNKYTHEIYVPPRAGNSNGSEILYNALKYHFDNQNLKIKEDYNLDICPINAEGIRIGFKTTSERLEEIKKELNQKDIKFEIRNIK